MLSLFVYLAKQYRGAMSMLFCLHSTPNLTFLFVYSASIQSYHVSIHHILHWWIVFCTFHHKSKIQNVINVNTLKRISNLTYNHCIYTVPSFPIEKHMLIFGWAKNHDVASIYAADYLKHTVFTNYVVKTKLQFTSRDSKFFKIISLCSLRGSKFDCQRAQFSLHYY